MIDTHNRCVPDVSSDEESAAHFPAPADEKAASQREPAPCSTAVETESPRSRPVLP